MRGDLHEGLSKAVTVAMDAVVHNRFLVAFGKSLGVILASEIGDKTFFIAAVMAMRNPRLTVGQFAYTIHNALPPAPSLLACLHTERKSELCQRGLKSPPSCGAALPRCSQVFAGAIGALAVMTVLSAALGWAAPNLVGGLGVASGAEHPHTLTHRRAPSYSSGHLCESLPPPSGPPSQPPSKMQIVCASVA